jgi:excisionase family DNA binding protein
VSAIVDSILRELTDEQAAELAQRLASHLKPHLDSRNGSEPWLTSDQAAEHLGCPRSRVHDLVQAGRLHAHRDGRRLRFRRSDLNLYLEGGGV